MPCNLQVFIRSNHADRAPASWRTDYLVTTGVRFRLEHNAKMAQTLAHVLANGRGMLSDSACKYQQFHSIQYRRKRPNGFPHGVAEHLNRKTRTRVAAAGFEQRSHVAGLSRNPNEARLMIHKALNLLGAILRAIDQMEQYSGIKITASGPHDDATGRRKSHRGLDRLSILDGCQTRAIAEVGNDGSVREVPAQSVHNGFV